MTDMNNVRLLSMWLNRDEDKMLEVNIGWTEGGDEVAIERLKLHFENNEQDEDIVGYTISKFLPNGKIEAVDSYLVDIVTDTIDWNREVIDTT